MHTVSATTRRRTDEQVGVRELRQNLSVYLARIAKGMSYRVTDRGKAVALLIPLPQETSVLDRLVAAGRATTPTGDLLTLPPLTGRPSRKASAALVADRADRL